MHALYLTTIVKTSNLVLWDMLNPTLGDGVGLAYPTYHNTTLESIHGARMATKVNAHTITIIIINRIDWTPQQLPITKHANIYMIVSIPSHIIKYDPTPEWPKYYHYRKQSLALIICIHNQSNPTRSPIRHREKYIIFT